MSTPSERLLDSNQDIKVNLGWQFVDTPIDLDVSVVVWDKYCSELKAVYFNERSVFDDLFIHSGDNRDGQHINENKKSENKSHKELESVAINLSRLNNLVNNDIDDGKLDSIHAMFIIVNIHKDNGNGKHQSFRDIESGKVTIYSADKAIFQRNLDCAKYSKNENYSSLLLAAIYKSGDEATVFKSDTEWKLVIFEKLGFDDTFNETSKSLIDDEILSHIYFDEDLIESRPNDRNIKYNLSKGQRYIFHPTMNRINVGLAWDCKDANSPIDMDCSVILLNDKLEEITMVNKLNKKYKGINSKTICEHLGDNKTGLKSNENGDDETVTINLDVVSADKEPVSTFAAYINIVSGAKSFKQIDNCYVRIYDPNTKQELCECKLQEFGEYSGIVVYNITQIAKTGAWQLFAKTVPLSNDIDPVQAVVEDLGGEWKPHQLYQESRHTKNPNIEQSTCHNCVLL